MSKITVFCQKCGEPDETGNSFCQNCGAHMEAPSKEFLEEVPENQLRGFELKQLLPGIKVGALAGLISGLFWGVPKVFMHSMSSSAISLLGVSSGLAILAIYIPFNVFCGIITGAVLAFFSLLHDMSGSKITSILVNIIISLFLYVPLSLLASYAIGNTLFTFFAVVVGVISGLLGGTVFSFTIPLIYNQYFTSK